MEEGEKEKGESGTQWKIREESKRMTDRKVKRRRDAVRKKDTKRQ